VTSILPVTFAPRFAAAAEPGGLDPSLLTQLTGTNGITRDAQIPDLAGAGAEVNQLQSLASAVGATPGPAIPAPALPTTQQQSQAQQAAAQPALKQDFYADGDDAG
jgi:hypothetical protein